MCAKVTACIIARTVSTRLPLKVFRLMDKDTSILDYIITRVKMCEKVDSIYLCTSSEPVDDIMEDVAWKNNINIYRGSADAVIERMIRVGEQTHSDYVIRITGDNVFTSYEYIDQQIDFAVKENLDYVRMVEVPIGATAEIMKFTALQHCYNAMDPSISEYLMLFMFNPDVYRCGIVKPFRENYGSYSLTVDYPADLMRTKEIMKHVDEEKFLTIELASIMDIIKKYNIPHSKLEPSGSIRLPYGKEMSHIDFKNDMDSRAARSFQINIE